MKEHTNILCFGCSDDILNRLGAALPSPASVIEQTNCATDLIALPCLAVVIAPDALSKADIEMLAGYYQEVPEETPLLTTPCPEFEQAGLHYRLLPEESQELYYALLQQIRTEKKSVQFYNSIVDALCVLKEITQQPGISTKKLAAVIERNERTALRYIHTLSVAGELIAYDQEKRGWYLMNGYSSLMEDALLYSSANNKKHVCFLGPEEPAGFTLPENNRDVEQWYRQSLSAFCETVPAQKEEIFKFMWYSMAEKLKAITGTDGQSSLCCDLLGDLMHRLVGKNDDCNEIMLDVLQQSPKYEELMRRFRLCASFIGLGSFWKEWGARHSPQECIELFEKLLPFWCWHEAYTLRFAECWAEQFHESERVDTSSFGMEYGEECLQEVVEAIQMHPHTPLQQMLTISPVSVWDEEISMDAEDVLLLFLHCGMNPEQAFRLACRVVHSKELAAEDIRILRESDIPRSAVDGLLCRTYIASRRKAAGKVLRTINLFPAD